MGSTPSSHATLRAFYNTPSFQLDPKEIARGVARESDRSAVVISASLIEDRLRDAIRKKFRKMDENEERELRLFTSEGPLGTFSAMINFAYALEIIDRETVGLLADIRQMRNACAHSYRQIDFSTPELVQVCKRLFDPAPGSFLRVLADDPATLRRAFMATCMAIQASITHGSRQEGAETLIRAVEEVAAEIGEPPGMGVDPK